VPFPFVSLIGCSREGLSRWRPEDYDAYKAVRVLSGRRIAGSVWLPAPGAPMRISNAHGQMLVSWFGGRVFDALAENRLLNGPAVLLPFPGPNRVVGAAPSGSRALAQELSSRGAGRVLDILRWRQRMPSCRHVDRQTFLDNLIITGSPVRADCVLVADFVASPLAFAAAADRLRQMSSRVVLAVSAGRVAAPARLDPFATEVEMIEDVS
jgi:hypothetical protein